MGVDTYARAATDGEDKDRAYMRGRSPSDVMFPECWGQEMPVPADVAEARLLDTWEEVREGLDFIATMREIEAETGEPALVYVSY